LLPVFEVAIGPLESSAIDAVDGKVRCHSLRKSKLRAEGCHSEPG
jgi:hypothetical protein